MIYRDNEENRLIIINQPMEGYIKVPDLQYMVHNRCTVWKKFQKESIIHFPYIGPVAKADFAFSVLQDNRIKSIQELKSQYRYGFEQTRLRLSKLRLDRELRPYLQPCLILPVQKESVFFPFDKSQERFKIVPLKVSMVRSRNYGYGEVRLYKDSLNRWYLGHVPKDYSNPFEVFRPWNMKWKTNISVINNFERINIEELL